MNWLSFAVISILTLSIAIIVQRALMRDKNSDPISYTIVFQLVVGLIPLFLAIGLGRFMWPTSAETVFRFILSAFLWSGATIFSFRAIKNLSAGELTILTTSSIIVSVILGILLLGETFNLSLAFGTILILLSIWIINSEETSFNSKSGIIYALLSALCAGIAVVNDAFILRSYDVFSYSATKSILSGIILLTIFPKRILKAKTLLNSKSIAIMTIFCLFTSTQAITYYLALQNGAPISQLAPLIKSSSVLTVILGAIFLNERRHLLKTILASIIVTIGVMLLG